MIYLLIYIGLVAIVLILALLFDRALVSTKEKLEALHRHLAALHYCDDYDNRGMRR